MIKLDIKNWMNGEVKFTAEIECTETDDQSLKFGLALKWAVQNKKDLQGAYLQGAYLQGAYLRGAELRGAYLREADLLGADLLGAYLLGADLRGAYLRGADLQGADLQGAYLQGAYLQGAYLQGAYLQGAYLRGADLRGAYLGEADGEKILLTGKNPIMQIGPIGSRSDYLTSYQTEKGIYFRVGCWFGTEQEFEKRIKKEHVKNNYAEEYFAALEFIKTVFSVRNAT